MAINFLATIVLLANFFGNCVTLFVKSKNSVLSDCLQRERKC